MKSKSRASTTFDSLLFIFVIAVIFLVAFVGANISDSSAIERLVNKYPLFDCEQCQGTKEEVAPSLTGVDNPSDEKDIDIIATYSDTSGAVRISRIKMRDLSASWVLENPSSGNHEQPKNVQRVEDSSESVHRFKEKDELSNGDHQFEGGNHYTRSSSMNPVKLKRRIMRRERRNLRSAELIRLNKEANDQRAEAAIERSKTFDTTVKGKYSLWRRDFENPNSDSTLKLIRDQIIMAKAYANLAKSMNESTLYSSLMTQSRNSGHAIGEASSDAELHPSALDQAIAMGRILAMAKDKLYDCPIMAKKI